jgi:gas vesicle protein/polyhydroxyalkanoate synthesis regulator phasin
MARELSIDVEVNSVEADAALARFANSLTATGEKADVAASKVEKFEKSYKDGQARTRAKKELDDLAVSTTKVGTAASAASKAKGAQALATSALTEAVARYAAPAVIGSAILKTVEWADDISDLAERTKLTTTQVQQIGAIATKSGSSFETFAAAINEVSRKLVSGKIDEQLSSMGLSTQELLAMEPYDRMVEIAKALAAIPDPAKRSAASFVLLGEKGDKLTVTLNELAAGADKLVPVVAEDMVDAGNKANSMWERFKGTVMAVTNEAILQSIAPFVSLISYVDDLTSSLESLEQVAARARAILPGTPAGNLPTPLAVPGNPMNGVGGNSWDFLNKSLTPNITTARGRGRAAANVLPFRQSTFALGSTAASIFGMANTPGGFNAGSLPFLSSLPFLQSGASPISFANGSGLAGTVGMNAPGAGGGGLGGFLRGRGTQIAGLGLGLLSRFIPTDGKLGGALSGASQGAAMGAMFGPWGMGIGAAAGGLMGLFTGGKAKKNARNAETSQVFEQFSSKEFVELQKQADKFGLSMSKALSAKTMKDFGTAVDEVNEKLREMNDIQSQIDALVEATTVDFDKMNKVVQEFGLDITKLGPAFQQAAIDKEAQRIIDAMAIMEKGGANMSGVLEGMADEISKLVQDSIKFGTTIPENMKPWIEELIKSGKLVDENGKAITDMSQIKFGAAMESDMSKLTKKLDELIQKLADMAEAFNNVRDAAAGAGNVDVGGPSGGGGGSDSGTPGFSTGGVAGRDFRRPGHGDIFPALLRRGERVLPPGASGGGMSLSIGNLTVGSGYGSRTDAVEEIGDAVVSYLERRGARLVA